MMTSKGKHWKCTQTHNKKVSRAMKRQWKQGIFNKDIISTEGLKKGRGFFKGKINVYSKKSLEKMSIAKRGSRHPCWKGGITSKYSRALAKSEWKKLRKEILERDNYICKKCGKYGNCVDHIVPWRIVKEHIKENSETLCRSCNSKKTFEDRRRYK